MSHPSPLNRTAHKGWESIALQILQQMDVIKCLTECSNCTRALGRINLAY